MPCLDGIQFVAEQDIRRAPARVREKYPPRLSTVAHVAQHAHQRGDSNSTTDEDEVVFVGVQRVREAAEGAVNGGAVTGTHASDRCGEVSALLDGQADSPGPGGARGDRERVLLRGQLAAEQTQELELPG